MCYSVESGTLKKRKYAIHRSDDADEVVKLEAELEILRETIPPYFHVNGFAHPNLLVFTNQEPYRPQAFQWGLVPSWAKDQVAAITISNQTLNARSETMFEKPTFKSSANSKRCLVYLDAFYEHHHLNKITYPFRISMKDGSPMAMAGLWNNWVDKATGEEINTVSIVTCGANTPMAIIHNNPKNEGPRMPVILPRENQNGWLIPVSTVLDQKILMELAIPYPAEEMQFHPVHKILGKEALGNIPEAEQPKHYPELELMLTQL